MRSTRPRRALERGNSLLLAMIVMSALATLGGLTVVSMESSIQMSTNDRAQTIAMYAAESGAAVTTGILRHNFDASPAYSTSATSWSRYCTPNNQTPLIDMSTVVPSSDARPGTTDANHPNLFDPKLNAWFHVDVLNNRDDPGYSTNTTTCDTDGILIIRSTGHGPQGSLAIIEWTIQRVGFWASVPPGGTPQPPPGVPATWPPVAPNFWMFPLTFTDRSTPPYPPSLTGTKGWNAWMPQSLDVNGVGPPSFTNVGVVLLGWRIVSL